MAMGAAIGMVQVQEAHAIHQGQLDCLFGAC
jgi:hypothetical protein